MTTVRKAAAIDIEELLRLEALAFQGDRLSRRSFKRWIKHKGCVFLVSDNQGVLEGYILVIQRRGTRLARLYSLAVDPACRGQGLASRLIELAEQAARDAGSLYMRLEVAGNNAAAITLYQKLGYTQFGLYQGYYEDHSDALRMEKCIHRLQSLNQNRAIPWISQPTPFTCGPASMMMAMNGLDPGYSPSQLEEVEIWREATTIFMTSGHGGCHPVGLALAATARGFDAEVWISRKGPLFVDGVRDPNKKRVISLVHESFIAQAKKQKMPVRFADIGQRKLAEARRTAGQTGAALRLCQHETHVPQPRFRNGADRRPAGHRLAAGSCRAGGRFRDPPGLGAGRRPGPEGRARKAPRCRRPGWCPARRRRPRSVSYTHLTPPPSDLV